MKWSRALADPCCAKSCRSYADRSLHISDPRVPSLLGRTAQRPVRVELRWSLTFGRDKEPRSEKIAVSARGTDHVRFTSCSTFGSKRSAASRDCCDDGSFVGGWR